MRVRSRGLGQCPPRRVGQGVREDPVMITSSVATVTIGQSAAIVSKETIMTSVRSQALACWRLIQLKQEFW